LSYFGKAKTIFEYKHPGFQLSPAINLLQTIKYKELQAGWNDDLYF